MTELGGLSSESLGARSAQCSEVDAQVSNIDA
jgi:hypothetical protein